MSDKPTPPIAGSKLMFATLAVLVWLPLPVGSNRDWWSALFVALTSLLCGFWAFSRLSQRHRAPLLAAPLAKAATPLLALLLLAQLWVGLQWLLDISVDSGETFRQLMLGIGYCLLFVLIVTQFYTRSRLILLVSTLVLSGTLQAFYGAYMTLSGTEWLLFSPKEHYRGVVTGTFVNRNHLAGYLEMTLACGIGLLMALRDGRPFEWRSLLELVLGPKARLRLALVIMVIALVMTHSRMGNTAFFSSLLIIGALFVLVNKEHRLRNGLILLSILLIDILVVSQYFGLDKLTERLASTQLEDKIVNGEVVANENVDRDDVFEYALPQLKEKPLTGFGAGSFKSSYQRYPGPDVARDFDHAHNDYLEFAIERGLIGLLPLALFVVMALYHGLSAMVRRKSLFRSGIGMGASMGILAIMIHSATDFNLQIPANAATFIVLCAIALLANKLPR